MVERGTCNFTVKVKNAQLAGAIAAVVINNAAGEPITLGGADATVTIPAGMISQADGNLIQAPVAGHRHRPGQYQLPSPRDSALDAGVVVHEYGHGISTRLTGGPANVTCLQNDEQMGEGWSDFFASALTARQLRPRQDPARHVHVPVVPAGQRHGHPADAVQHRHWRSTRPPTRRSPTPRHSLPHGIGYVWNSMLWEVYWNLVNRHGYNGNLYEPGAPAATTWRCNW